MFFGLTLAALLSVEALAADRAVSSLQEVVIVFKTHFDIGYTDFASNVVSRYRTTMIDEALRVVELSRPLPAEQQFAWTIPGWPAARIAMDWPGQTASRKEQLSRAFKDGRFVVHGLPFTTHTELLETEDLVRGLGFASSISRASGLPLPRDAKMTDVPCHSWILPTLLKSAGIDFLHLGCNAASSSPQVPVLFWWEGPDGARLLTMYSASGYGTGLVPPDRWPYRTWLALIHTGDNHGPPTPEEVQTLLAEAARTLPGVKVRIGRLSDFADGILAEKAEIPVIRGDMPDTWIHGPMCDPAGAKVARHMRPVITIAEGLHAQLKFWGMETPSITSSIAAAYEKSLLYGEHTWGGALYWVSKYSGNVEFEYGEKWRADQASGRFKRLEDSWDEHSSYIYAARDIVQPLLKTNLHLLARAVQTEGRRIVVYNPLPWKRSGLVEFEDSQPNFAFVQPLDTAQETASPRDVAAASKLTVNPSEVPVAWVGQRGSFIANDIPAMGYRTFIASKSGKTSLAARRSPENILENRFFRLTLDATNCCVSSVIDKGSGRELVETSAAHGFGQYLYERFDSNDVANFVKAYVKISADWATNELGKPNRQLLSTLEKRSVSPKHGQLIPGNAAAPNTSSAMQADDLADTATMLCPAGDGIPHGVELKVTLYRDLPFLDLEVTVRDKPADPWPEAGWICLPFRVDDPRFRVGRLGSIIDPQRDIVAGANRHLLGVNTGVALFDEEGRGAGFCVIDSPLVSLDTPGCWRYSLDFVPRRPVAYVNLFNNQWSTNFRLWNSGTWSSRVRVWAIDHYEPGRSLVTPSLEARYPLQAAVEDGPTGTLPPRQEGIELDQSGILMTALGDNPDGEGTILRLWELAGRSGACGLRFPQRMKVRSLQPIDLRGRILGKAIAVTESSTGGGLCIVSVKGFAPASFLLGF